MITSLALVGACTFYSPGLMERVAGNRGLSCPNCVGFAAMVDPGWLGQRIWITRPGERPEGPFLVVDCGREDHRAAQNKRGLVCEVDFPTAVRWRMNGPVPAIVMQLAGFRAGPQP